MNSIAHNVAAKLTVAFVAVAMLFTMAAPAKAATAEEMQKMINDLLAQVAALQGQLGGGSTPDGYRSVCPFTWTRTLTPGSTGADVMKLQQFLNSDAETRVAAAGVGSVGQETQYYGPATAAAVSRLQVKYRAEILTPSGLVNPTGTFGPATMAKANALCVTGATDNGDDDDDDDSNDDDDDNNSGDLSGEASLDTVEISDGEESDEVEEGSEDVQVAEIEVSFDNGDAMITRLDLILDGDANTVNTESDPWDVFEDISLWVDGDEVARMDASDEDEYLDEDDGSLRFSGLDIRADEDEEVTIVVAVSVTGSVDNAGSATLADWDIYAAELRYVDADDVTTTETDLGDLEDGTNSTLTGTAMAEFTIETAGAGDDLDLESSDEDPDATTFALEEDENVEEAIFAFDLSAEDSDGDVDLNEVVIDVTVANTSNVDDLVNDFRLEIDGQSYDAESYTGTGLSAALTFDIDGDVTIAAEETVTAVLYADFNELDDEGATIFASTSATDIDAEGEDDVSVDGGEVTSETHTLRTEGADVALTDTSATLKANTDSTTTDDEGVYEIEFEVTAFGDDLYIDDTADQNTVENNFGVNYTIENSAGTVIASTTAAAVATLSSDADQTSGGYFRVDEGETETFTLRVEFDPATTGSYKVVLYSVNYNTTADTAANTQQVLSPETDYDTGFLTI